MTNGHISLVERALGLFDELIVAVAQSSTKKTLFTGDERLEMAKKSLNGMERVRVETFDNLLAEYAHAQGASAIIRGLRAISDFEFEFQMALMNRRIAREVETVFLMPALSWVYLSSTIVKDVARNGGDVSDLVPEAAQAMLKKKFGQ
ncbi:MAG: pantetheine-phosphate adenylyltransferase [FCB group bacterium]|nr:pantetheine-phosphate adenylyltransferase [FCB group bacterium]